jgi:hypothetical protein
MKKSQPTSSAFASTLALTLLALGLAISPASRARSGDAAFVAGTYTITPSSDGTVAQMQVAGIQDTMSGGTSGTLGVELWYSPTPFSGSGTLTGYRVSARYLPIGNCTTVNLAAGSSCTGIVVDANVSLPPAGTYYPVLALVEYSSSCTTNNGYCYDDYIALMNLTTGGPTVTVGSAGGGGSGGGGGGTGGSGNTGAAKLSGTAQVSAINWANDTVDIQVASVVNTTTNVTTGSLAVQLWFLASPYTGGSISGFKVASAQLPASCTIGQAQLSPGTSCNSLDTGTITVTPPPSGTYYAVLALEEYSSTCTTNGGYCIDNAIQLQNTETVPAQTGSGGGTGGSGASSGTYGNAQLSGLGQVSAIDWTGDTVDIHLATVTNTTTNATTGTLDVELWFTSSPYAGGSINGYKVASFRLPASCTTGQSQLGPEQSCTSIDSGTIAVTPPPAGTYYAVLSLGEYNSQACNADGGFCLDNAVQLQSQETVPSATTSPSGGSGSGGGGGGGGGGSLDIVTLVLGMLLLASRPLLRLRSTAK